ncbi:MAG TPA: antibiotic biosynthesis monooxygenase family protein [Rhodocyclaceae bacterium]|nr:antibiotic biosynthesis monooxygenase family protein [Rhodocyclaceae bacterium]
MSITRINQFEAKPDCAEKLYAFLQSVISVILTCEGCISCKLLRSAENPACLAIIEEWGSIASHQKAATAIPPEKLAEAGALFAKPPVGMYYTA